MADTLVNGQTWLRRACRGLLVALFMQCLSAAVWAQTVAVGSITGIVKDQSGAAVAGVTVTAESPVLIEKSRTATTNSQGQYNLVDLLPGDYSVTFTDAGFNTLKREGIHLTADFTAKIDVTLSVGAVTQTVVVQSVAPLVDVSNVNAETNLSQKLLYNAPVSANVLGFSALTVGAIIPQTAQDVGGSKGEISVRLAFHGGHSIEQKLLLNGMIYNTLLSVGNRTFFPNPASTEEFTLSNGEAGSAEFLAAGTVVNTVPEEGGNQFHGTFYTDESDSSLQMSNVTPELVSKGLTISSGINKLYDYRGAFGGRIIKDRLWFFTGYRNWGDSERGSSLQYNANPNSYTYTPNGVPVAQYNSFRNADGNLTWQATSKDKLTFSIDDENDCLCNSVGGTLFSSNVSEEASQGGLYLPDRIWQATWTRPVSQKLLLSAGMTIFQLTFKNFSQPNAATDGISVVDSGLGLTYRAPASVSQIGLDPLQNYRASASYITGSHNYKVGMLLLHGSLDETTVYNSSAVSYTFVNGVPSSITEYAAPLHTRWVDSPTLGLYFQDQWAIKRLTLSYGVRWDYQRDYVPANSLAAGVFVPARTFNELDCVPCWNDLDPRIGASYDLKGNGKTALKAGIGRFVLSQTTGLASTADPASTTVASTTRSWKDTRTVGSANYYVPNCILTNPAANGDCGAVANNTFGTSVVTTTYDPNVLTGWFHRPYNWQLSAGVQHQFGSNMMVSAMYFRTWYGNFTVTDNLDTPPSDFSPYCITAPSNPSLPGGGGYQICGLYDLNPAQVGQTNNYVTFSSKFGKQTEVYNGVDLTMQLRLHRTTIGGGMNIGNSGVAITGSNGTTSSQSDCFVVNSPQQLYQCNQPIPPLVQVKFNATQDLPWGFQILGDVQSIPGIPRTASYSVSNTVIEPSLGRNLSACSPTAALGSACSSATVSLILPQSVFENRINQVDFRFAKVFHIRDRITVEGIADLANAFNASPLESENLTYGSKWLTPTTILDPRLAKFGAKVDF